MHKILVAYDLRSKNREYMRVYKYLNSLDYAYRLTESVWAIKSNYDVAEIMDQMQFVCKTTDRVVVAEILSAEWFNSLCANDLLRKAW